MNIDTINDEAITRYLLGDLPDEQIEMLDELAVSDGQFFERVGAAENDLVDRYVNGELTEAEIAGVESHYLNSPKRREKIALARSFLEFARDRSNMVRASVEQESSSRGVAAFLVSFNQLWGGRPALSFGIAAAVALALLAGVLVLRSFMGNSATDVAANVAVDQNVSMITPTPEPSPVEAGNTGSNQQTFPTPTPSPVASETKASVPLIASFVLSPPLRGNNFPSLSIPAGTETVAIRLQLDSDEFKAYSVELKDPSGRVLYRPNSASARGSQRARSINIQIPARVLKPGIYTVSLSGMTDKKGATEAAGDYPFRVAP